jgi:hypothetical protein
LSHLPQNIANAGRDKADQAVKSHGAKDNTTDNTGKHSHSTLTRASVNELGKNGSKSWFGTNTKVLRLVQRFEETFTKQSATGSILVTSDTGQWAWYEHQGPTRGRVNSTNTQLEWRRPWGKTNLPPAAFRASLLVML